MLTQQDLFNAAKTGDFEKLKQCIDQSIDIAAQDINGRNALHYAAIGGQVAMFDYLVSEYKLDPFKTVLRWSLLPYAFRSPKYDHASMLIALAAANGQIQMFDHLIQRHKLSETMLRAIGPYKTLLNFVAVKGPIQMLDHLVKQYKLNVFAEDMFFGSEVLSYALKRRDATPMLEHLIKKYRLITSIQILSNVLNTVGDDHHLMRQKLIDNFAGLCVRIESILSETIDVGGRVLIGWSIYTTAPWWRTAAASQHEPVTRKYLKEKQVQNADDAITNVEEWIFALEQGKIQVDTSFLIEQIEKLDKAISRYRPGLVEYSDVEHFLSADLKCVRDEFAKVIAHKAKLLELHEKFVQSHEAHEIDSVSTTTSNTNHLTQVSTNSLEQPQKLAEQPGSSSSSTSESVSTSSALVKHKHRVASGSHVRRHKQNSQNTPVLVSLVSAIQQSLTSHSFDPLSQGIVMGLITSISAFKNHPEMQLQTGLFQQINDLEDRMRNQSSIKIVKCLKADVKEQTKYFEDLCHAALEQDEAAIRSIILKKEFSWQCLNSFNQNVFHKILHEKTVKSDFIAKIFKLIPISQVEGQPLLVYLLRQRDDDGNTPLMLAIRNDRRVTLQEAMQRHPELSDARLIHFACKVKAVNSLKVLLGYADNKLLWKPEPSEPTANYPLHTAIANGFSWSELEAVFFINSAAPLTISDLKNAMGQTCLHVAVLHELPKIFGKLVKNRKETEKAKIILNSLSVNTKGETPLHLICQQQYAASFMAVLKSQYDEAYQLLLQLRNREDNEGKLALHYAAENGIVELVDLFGKGQKEFVVDINAIDLHSSTALMHAVHAGQEHLVRYLADFSKYPALSIYAQNNDNKNVFSLVADKLAARNPKDDSAKLITIQQILIQYRTKQVIFSISKAFKSGCLTTNGHCLYEALKTKTVGHTVGSKKAHNLLQLLQSFLNKHKNLLMRLQSLSATESPELLIKRIATALATNFSRLYEGRRDDLLKLLENYVEGQFLDHEFSNEINCAIDLGLGETDLNIQQSSILQIVKACVVGINPSAGSLREEPSYSSCFRNNLRQRLYSIFYVSNQILHGSVEKPQADYSDLIEFAQGSVPMITAGLSTLTSTYLPGKLAGAIEQGGNLLGMALPLINNWRKNKNRDEMIQQATNILNAFGTRITRSVSSVTDYELKEDVITQVCCGFVACYSSILMQMKFDDIPLFASLIHQCIVQHISAGETQFNEDVGLGYAHSLSRFSKALSNTMWSDSQPTPERLELFERCLVAVQKEKIENDFDVELAGKLVSARDILKFGTYKIITDSRVEYYVHRSCINDPFKFGICLGFSEIDSKLRKGFIRKDLKEPVSSDVTDTLVAQALPRGSAQAAAQHGIHSGSTAQMRNASSSSREYTQQTRLLTN